MGARGFHSRSYMLRSTPIFRRAPVHSVVAATLAIAAAAHNAPAQRIVAPAGLAPRASAQIGTAADLTHAERDSLARAAALAGTDRLRTVAGYTLLGGAVGAAAGLVYGAIAYPGSRSNEDGNFAQAVTCAAGGVVGLVVGGVVGLARSAPRRDQPRTAAE